MAKKQEMAMACDCGGCGCGCWHHKAGPVLVILFGLLFVAGNYGWVSSNVVTMTWPWLVALWGAMKLVTKSGWCNCC